MKLKLNLQGGIQGVLIQHGEKMVLGLAGFVLLLFVWSVFRHDLLDPSKQPENIVQQAMAADSHIGQMRWSRDNPEAPPRMDYVAMVRRGFEELPLSALAHSTPWNRPLFEPPQQRADPDLFPPLELQASAGRGALAIRSAVDPSATLGRPPTVGPRPSLLLEEAMPGEAPRMVRFTTDLPGVRAQGADMEGRRYVVITGLIPVLKQHEEYQRRFRDAQWKDPARDVPTYRWFRVERTDLTTGAVELIDVQQSVAALRDTQRWAVDVPEIVRPEYVHERLTWKLPPMFLKDWGREAAHPKIPLAQETEEGMMEEEGPDMIDPLAADPLRTPRGSAFETGRLVGPRPPGAFGRPLSDEHQEALTPHRLFRFFDFSVQPGRSYRYRVQLIVENPNYQVEPRYLERVESRNERFRDTAWSEPSPVVTVPRDFQLLASGLRRVAGLEVAKVRVIAWDHARALELGEEFELPKGGLANFRRDLKDVVIPNRMVYEDIKDFSFLTYMTLIDLRGGEPLPGVPGAKAPIELLWVDPQGNLAASNEAEDELVWEDFRHRTYIPPEDPLSEGGFGFGGLLEESETPRPSRGRTRTTEEGRGGLPPP